MIVYVTKDFLVNDSANREEQGVVVRVDQMKEGRWGIAVHLTRDIWRNRVT
jgi:phenylpyruvate tautomerase PptA (4-oxalocrotonate tautomerase family)